jgi:hypothetical protein
MRLFTAALTLSAAALCLSAALAADKDTPAAETTRKVIQSAKVSVEYSKTYLRDVLADLSKQVSKSGQGKLEFTKTPGTGVNLNTKIDLKMDDAPLADVLAAVCKGRNFGYVVVSKAGDKDDGKVLWTVGDERGYAADSGSAPKPTKKEPPTTEPTKKDPAPTTDANEAKAAGKLEFAKMLVADGKKEKAAERLEGIIKEFPGTKAAAEAQEMLKKLK